MQISTDISVITLLVFLRALEYYSGILFLTTNRVGSIDEAFRSRIHMSLYYPILSPVQTEKIWRAQLLRARERDPTLILNIDNIISYVMKLFKEQMDKRKVGWNGRQIRNAMKTAISLAEYDSLVKSEEYKVAVPPDLDIRWFGVVAHASWEFDAYLEKAMDMTTMNYAKLFGRRDDTARRDEGKLAFPFSFPGTWQGPTDQQVLQQQQFPQQQQQYAVAQPGLYFNTPDAQNQQAPLFGSSPASTAPGQQYQPIRPQYAAQQNRPQPAQHGPSAEFVNSIPTINTMRPAVQPTSTPQMAPGMSAQGQGSVPGLFQHPQRQGQQSLFGQHQHTQSTGNQNLQQTYGVNPGGPSHMQPQPGTAVFPGYGNPGGAPGQLPQPGQMQHPAQ